MRCIAIGCYGVAVALFFSAAHAQHRAVDRNLIASGFVMRPADTPGKMKALQALRPYKFASRTKNGVRYYIYPDPADCRCAFVGYQQAFDTYRDMVAPPPPPPGTQEFKSDATNPGFNLENFTVDQMNEDAGLMDGDDIFHLNFN
jgi:hypothetical protein